MSEAPKPYNPFEARFGKSSTVAIALVTGLILIAFALFLLVESEWRASFLAVERTERASMVEVDLAAPDPANEGRLVLLAGEVEPSNEPPAGAPPGVLSYREIQEEYDGEAWIPVEHAEDGQGESWFAEDALAGGWTIPHRLWRRMAEVDLTGDPEGQAAAPEAGMQRTRLVGVPAGLYTMAGEQSGDSLSPWRSAITESRIFLMEPGLLSREELLPPVEVDDVQLVWMKRGGAFLAIFLGLGTLFGAIGAGTTLGPVRWWLAMLSLTLGMTVLFAGISSMLAAGIGTWLLGLGIVFVAVGLMLLRSGAETENSPGDEAAGGAS